MNIITLVCVFNNKNILNNYLLNSLKNLHLNIEIILLDNTKGKFSSAAEALNYGGKKAKGKYIIFVHQDVKLYSNVFDKITKILNKLPNLGIAGVAGRKKYVITNIKHGIPPRPAGKIQIKKPIKVKTVDECLFIIPKKVFQIVKFDEKTCDDWHLYAVDYCLSINNAGYNIYTIPSSIYHLSTGYLSEKYYSTLIKVVKKHKKKHKLIYTTVRNWRTSIFSLLIYKILAQGNIPENIRKKILKLI
jgi:GT2 family glycosyltransferase